MDFRCHQDWFFSPIVIFHLECPQKVISDPTQKKLYFQCIIKKRVDMGACVWKLVMSGYISLRFVHWFQFRFSRVQMFCNRITCCTLIARFSLSSCEPNGWIGGVQELVQKPCLTFKSHNDLKVKSLKVTFRGNHDSADILRSPRHTRSFEFIKLNVA